jgi:very-short-patch-repair endonuclease
MTAKFAAGAPLVIDLLNYIEQVEKLKSKPAFSVPTEFFVSYQHELMGLPELGFNLQVGSDDVWLRIPRLQEIAPPALDEDIKPWVTLSKSPLKRPDVKNELPSVDDKGESIRLHLKDLPEIAQVIDWYILNQWTPWASAEAPRRKTMALYHQLFSFQQAVASEGAETPLELVWGMGCAAWKKEGFATPLKYPLLVQACEIYLDPRTFELEVRPRDVEPRLEADCYAEMEVPGITQLEAFWRSSLATGANRLNPFEPSTYEGALKAAVGHLDPSGSYEVRSDNLIPPVPNDKLAVTNTWVLFGRKRSGDIFIEDIRRLKKNVESALQLPGVIRSFVEPGDATVKVRPEQDFRGLASSDASSQAMELYFPMAYNDEQVSIIQKLHANDGVVVQGPPGTGKTHTIGNVICHYLAQGKRVLVTAKGESALAVLQEKLPERIRPLSVALLSDERDGMKQFEHAIQTIASSVAGLNPSRAAQNIAAAEQDLNQLHAKIAHVDQSVTAHASRHMQSYPFQGREIAPDELAKLVLEQADAHQWFDDEPALVKDGKDSDMAFDDDAIHSLRRSRMRVAGDLSYLALTQPLASEFPLWVDMLGLHRDLVKAKTIDAGVDQGDILSLVDSRTETFKKAQQLAQFLQERDALMSKMSQSEAEQLWLKGMTQKLADIEPSDPVLQALLALCDEIRLLETKRRDLLAKSVQVPDGAELDEDVVGAMARLLAGKSAFAFPFGKGDARKMMAAVTVGGSPVDQVSDWVLVHELLNLRQDCRKAIARWASYSAEFGLPVTESGIDPALRQLAVWRLCVVDAWEMSHSFNTQLLARLSEVLGSQVADQMLAGGEAFIDRVQHSLIAHLDKGRLSYAMNRMQELMQKLDGHSGQVVQDLREFLIDAMGNPQATEADMQSDWVALHSELARLKNLGPDFAEIDRITVTIEAAGAPNWAKRLRTLHASVDADLQIPATWRDAWDWRQAVMLLDGIDGHHKLRALFEERKALTTQLAKTYQDLIAEKTWLGVYNNSPDSVRQALQAYLNAVQAMGAGTGVRAVRYRKNAREAMLKAYQAVPCWVLPQWRVSETIPPEVGLFDLVVIDEASQSDIWALPALLRGRKVLVVGDHKQVSPSAVGMAEEKIKDLTHRFLAAQPHGAQMTPDKSIYDLARVVFAGNSVMLKEHFRCVPAIIEFSNREIYRGDIRPLRVPKANERLDPPLVDVFVRGGNRQGDVNEPEAQAIVAEIESILADPIFDGRSIGVVTLLGTSQAARIHTLVNERISPVDVLSRKIAVGPPPVFQGRERDIMMISMVLGPGDRAAANRADMEQRFNVALSRARDRMYLFRSVPETQFKEETLNGKVISHFKQPFRQDTKRVQELRERCESGFERDMFDVLVQLGFRVQPQVPCGGYRIDMVIEGNEGRRLAIECDGDRYHGPGQWQDDMSRQRVLERAGWTFWRCFASSFVRRRDAVIEDLVSTLERLGIEPLGSETVDNTVWVHHKEVDPMGIFDDAEEDQATAQLDSSDALEPAAAQTQESA